MRVVMCHEMCLCVLISMQLGGALGVDMNGECPFVLSPCAALNEI